MERINHNGEEFTVREASRPAGWLCRHLVSPDGEHEFLEYVVSVGPYKIDLCRLHRLSREESEGHRLGTVSLGELARRLAADEESSGSRRT